MDGLGDLVCHAVEDEGLPGCEPAVWYESFARSIVTMDCFHVSARNVVRGCNIMYPTL